MICALLVLAVVLSLGAGTPNDSAGARELECLNVSAKLIPEKPQPSFLVLNDSPGARELKRLKVPAKLIPEERRSMFLLRAEGVQIYRGIEKDGTLQWSFDAPSAVLLDYETGEKVGTHSKGSGGPVWEGNDGSKVEGKRLASERAPNPNAIDWLLLEGKGIGGKGRFSKVAFIARVDTWAGREPTTKPGQAGAVKEVRYQATYVFWGE